MNKLGAVRRYYVIDPPSEIEGRVAKFIRIPRAVAQHTCRDNRQESRDPGENPFSCRELLLRDDIVSGHPLLPILEVAQSGSETRLDVQAFTERLLPGWVLRLLAGPLLGPRGHLVLAPGAQVGRLQSQRRLSSRVGAAVFAPTLYDRQ